MVVCNVRTVRSLRSFTRQCRYTSFPSCVVTFAVMFVSSKNGYGSWVVLSSDSSSTSSSGRSVYGGEISCQKCRGIVLKVLSFSPILATGKRNGFGWNGAEKTKDNFQKNGVRESQGICIFLIWLAWLVGLR